jgi:hypothetical protein
MSNQARCLCGSLRWEITAEPLNAFNCHCKLCRKAHGSGFATYWYVAPDAFRWLSATDSLVRYRSSPLLERSFCGTCGSVVPYPSEQGDHWAVPAGPHDDGRTADANIFVAHRAPWFEVTGDLPRYDDYPEYTGMKRVEEQPLEPGPDGVVRGSCMCGAVKYEVVEPFMVVHNCHCHRCRRARAAANATNGFTSMQGVQFVQGEGNLESYKVPDAEHFTQVFCRTCGSKMPRLDPGRNIAVIPFGSLDDDPQTKPVDHIYVDYMAKWDRITDDLPQFGEEPKR